MFKDDCINKTLNSWRDLHEHQIDGWVYRGQSKSPYNLKNSLERACDRWGVPLTRADEVEQQIIREFKRRLHHYTIQSPRENAYIEWISLMQHYGAPTRLLDFSYSIYVSVYFALEKAETKNDDCVVWAINGRWAVQASKRKHASREIKKLFDEPIDEKREALLGKVLFKGPIRPLVVTINPFRLNERLTLQKGVFLCPGDVTQSFEKNLKSLDGYEKNIKRIRIPYKLRKGILKKLYEMNVTRATLFPGLDGFAQSLSIFPPVQLIKGSIW